ncbi:stalk domain-containing protein [Anaerovorax odorimutans]|uniref:stalk domain-containing protein n=1 Tax=Anaerovorax odorimutans TaxID=109327 RepID=UPI0003FF5001|nr:stalk domain-containing protein [Anaerovorax odorimutans]
MIKKMFAVILMLCVVNGSYVISFAAEPMLKIWVYAPNYMLNCLDNVVSYGVAYTNSEGKQKTINFTKEYRSNNSLGKYENNKEFFIPAGQIFSTYIDYVYVNVLTKTSGGDYEDTTYYYNSDGTSSLFKEGFGWDKKEDKNIMVYLDSPYVITIKNDKNINSYYIKSGGKSSDEFLGTGIEYSGYENECGKQVYFHKDNRNITVINKDSHVYVPLESLAELFKLKINYSEQDDNTIANILSADGNISLVLNTKDSSYTKNGNIEYFKDEQKAFISEKSYYVPLRFLEGLDMGIEYSKSKSMIFIKPRTYKI